MVDVVVLARTPYEDRTLPVPEQKRALITIQLPDGRIYTANIRADELGKEGEKRAIKDVVDRAGKVQREILSV